MADARRLCLSLALVVLAASGCVRRELEILSTPPEATVEIDGEILTEKTPIREPFWWYGTHEIVVTKEGYRREALIASVRPPWWEWFPIDFVPDVLLPWTIKDVHTYPFQLQKAESVADKPDSVKQALKSALLERAGKFRTEAQGKISEVKKTEETPAPAETEKPKEPEKTEQK